MDRISICDSLYKHSIKQGDTIFEASSNRGWKMDHLQ